MIKQLLWVGLGGGIGSIIRYVSSLMIPSKSFPFATLTVNIAGSFLMGIIFAMSNREMTISGNWRLFLGTGICGGFTTFSAFSLDNINLLQTGKTLTAFTYISCSILLGIGACLLGYQLFKNQA